MGRIRLSGILVSRKSKLPVLAEYPSESTIDGLGRSYEYCEADIARLRGSLAYYIHGVGKLEQGCGREYGLCKTL